MLEFQKNIAIIILRYYTYIDNFKKGAERELSISFDSEKKIFSISTENSSYIMGIAANEILTHVYYGARVEEAPNIKGMYS